jgi:hypothetical protein
VAEAHDIKVGFVAGGVRLADELGQVGIVVYDDAVLQFGLHDGFFGFAYAHGLTVCMLSANARTPQSGLTFGWSAVDGYDVACLADGISECQLCRVSTASKSKSGADSHLALAATDFQHTGAGFDCPVLDDAGSGQIYKRGGHVQ